MLFEIFWNSKDSKSELIFFYSFGGWRGSCDSCDFSLNESCKTYPGPMLPPGVNFTNILWAAFCMKVFYAVFLRLQFGFVIFWQKEFGTKAAHKILVKLTPGRRNWQLIYPYYWNWYFKNQIAHSSKTSKNI